jgi:hypothetical protein
MNYFGKINKFFILFIFHFDVSLPSALVEKQNELQSEMIESLLTKL